MRPNPWLYIPKKNPAASLRLVCFPYAGASASIFRPWADKLPDWVELVAIQLPGRENRFAEPLIDNAFDAAQAVAEALGQLGGTTDMVFFGHSLGGTVAYETAQRLHQSRSAIAPGHVIVSGRRAPTVPPREKQLHTLSDPELKLELKDLNCTPPEILEHDELMEMLMPRLRADFAMAENYSHRHQAPLPCPLSAFGGLDDKDVTEADVRAWSGMTAAAFDCRMYAGDHFFLHGAEREVLASIRTVIERVRPAQFC